MGEEGVGTVKWFWSGGEGKGMNGCGKDPEWLGIRAFPTYKFVFGGVRIKLVQVMGERTIRMWRSPSA